MNQVDLIKKIRAKTGLGIYDIKKALDSAKGNEKTTMVLLKDKIDQLAKEKALKTADHGLIDAYLHTSGKIGVLIEISCQSDFVAKNQEFQNLVHDIALQIASMSPKDIKQLLTQPFIKDENITIGQLLNQQISKFGENINIKRFIRYQQGE